MSERRPSQNSMSRRTLALWLFGGILMIAYLVSGSGEKSRVTKGVYQNFEVTLERHRRYTTIDLYGHEGTLRLHGIDQGNDDSVDYSEHLRGPIRNDSPGELIQAAYDHVRRKGR